MFQKGEIHLAAEGHKTNLHVWGYFRCEDHPSYNQIIMIYMYFLYQFVAAVEKYREVLRSVEEHKDTLHTDSLQQLHAMYNLSEILSSKPEGVDPTLRDDQLSTQVTSIQCFLCCIKRELYSICRKRRL